MTGGLWALPGNWRCPIIWTNFSAHYIISMHQFESVYLILSRRENKQMSLLQFCITLEACSNKRDVKSEDWEVDRLSVVVHHQPTPLMPTFSTPITAGWSFIIFPFSSVNSSLFTTCIFFFFFFGLLNSAQRHTSGFFFFFFLKELTCGSVVSKLLIIFLPDAYMLEYFWSMLLMDTF